MTKKILLFLSFIVILFIYLWFVTHGSFKLFVPEYNGGMDYLSKSLLRGSSETILPDVGYEYYYVNGKFVSHFSPLPAVLRILPLNLFPQTYGKLSNLFCIIANLLSVFGFLKIVQYSLLKNPQINKDAKDTFELYSLLSFALGTPLMILIASGYIYNECRGWGFCSTVWGLYYLIRLIKEDLFYKKHLIIFSTCAGLALTSKESFGILLYFLLIVLIIWIFKESKSNKRQLLFLKDLNTNKKTTLDISDNISLIDSILKCLIPSFILTTFQFWYNYDRFGNIFTFFNREYHKDYKEIVSNLGGDLNIIRIPMIIEKYLGFRSDYFSNKFPHIMGLAEMNPFLSLSRDNYLKSFYSSELTIPLTIASIWIISTSVISWFLLYKKKTSFIIKMIFLVFILFPLLTTCSHWYTTERYTLEFMPLLIFSHHIFLTELNLHSTKKINLNIFLFTFKALCLFSIYATFFFTLEWSFWLADWGKYEILTPDLYNKIDVFIKNCFIFLKSIIYYITR